MVQQAWISSMTGQSSRILQNGGMQTNTCMYAGLDQVGKQYVLCLLDEKGQSPHYYQGRSDTKKGQEKCLSLLESPCKVLSASTPFGLLLLATFGEEKLTLKSEDEHYAIWQRAGVERGRKMARFAALLLFSAAQSPKNLDERERNHLLAMQGEEMEALQHIGDESQQALDTLLAGVEERGVVDKALRLEVKSRQVLTGVPSKESTNITVEEEGSFFSQLYNSLQKLK